MSSKKTVQVVAKVRPFVLEETAKNQKNIAAVDGTSISIGSQKAQLSAAFNDKVKLAQVYSQCCETILPHALEGQNVALLGLGASRSGKSYALSGSEDDPGVIPCMNKGLFDLLGRLGATQEFFVTCSYLQIQGDELLDLLNPHHRAMTARHQPQFGVLVDNLSEIKCRSADDIALFYEQGTRAKMVVARDTEGQRQPTSTFWIVRVSIRNRSSDKPGIRSTLLMADLAALDKEGDANRSVQNLIKSLGDKKAKADAYKASPTTQLLQDALGGSCYTVAILTLSPSEADQAQSQQTLSVGQSILGLSNSPKANSDDSQSVINSLRDEISRLRDKLASLPITSLDRDEVSKLQDLVASLEVTKRQTWEEKERLSRSYEDERKLNLANRGIAELVMEQLNKSSNETKQHLMQLQRERDNLMAEYKQKKSATDELKEQLETSIKEYSKLAELGKSSDKDVKKQLATITELREKFKVETNRVKELRNALREVNDNLQRESATAGQTQAAAGGISVEQMYRLAVDERSRLEEEHKKQVEDEMNSAHLEIRQEKGDIKLKLNETQFSKDQTAKLLNELADLKSERKITALRITLLQQEKDKQLQQYETLYQRHKQETEMQQLQHFQTFRNYRQVFDRQRVALDQRYRQVLEDSIQDAVYLSSRNNELNDENQNLKLENATLRDRMTILEGASKSKVK